VKLATTTSSAKTGTSIRVDRNVPTLQSRPVRKSFKSSRKDWRNLRNSVKKMKSRRSECKRNASVVKENKLRT